MVYAENQINEPWIGIDLGTKTSIVGIWDGNTVKILRSEKGKTPELLPSCVSYALNAENDEVFVGGDALKKMHTLPKSTIFDAKRFIGREFSSLDDDNISNYPF